MKKHLKPFQVYSLCALVIFSWWFLAFHKSFEKTSIAASSSPPSTTWNTYDLSPLNRNDLKKALDGDLSLMTKLIVDWEVDAELLELQGLSPKRLSKESFVRSQLLGRHLANTPVEKEKGRYLPQTYVSASFLLALISPQEIVAIPKGLRSTPQLFSRELLDQIPLDCDRNLSEKLYQARPELAFVSHYSHPSTIEALKNQGVELLTLSNLDTLSDITETLLSIGNAINRPQEAELMAYFLEAALQAIDNRLLALNFKGENQKILYLSDFAEFSLPSLKTLTGQMLARIGIPHYGPAPLLIDRKQDWSIPLDQEQIANFYPDYVIIATAHREATKRKIEETPAFSTLPAKQNNKIFCIDEVVQNFPSQYIVLAYFDLAHTLFLAKQKAPLDPEEQYTLSFP